MNAYVTGGTGFLGKALVRKLLERGHQVTALVRSEAGVGPLVEIGAQVVRGDVTDRERLQATMPGHDVVFHVAGWYKLGARDTSAAEKVNVEGTRNVIEVAHALGIPRIVYTSSVAVFGNTAGKDVREVDENYRMPEGQPFATVYDRSKWRAHYEVARPLAEKGAPVISLMPGAIYGHGDPSLNGQILRAYYKGWLPILPGSDTVLTHVHVDDVAEAHILAAEKGEPGEEYIVTGPPLSLGELAQVWARVSGRRPPLVNVPSRYIKPMEGLADFLGKYLPMPELLSGDGVCILGLRYVAWPGKAHEKLGWGVRDIDEGIREVFQKMDEENPAPPTPIVTRHRQVAGMTLLAAFAVLTVILLSRKRK